MRGWLALLLFAANAQAGDVERGRALVADRTQSLCLLCHALTAAGDANQGNLAPPLDATAKRLNAAGLRERIADMRRFNPATVMPPFRSTEGLRDVAPAWQGKPALTAQQLLPQRCPLCGGPNACAMAEDTPGACWCFDTPIAEGALERIPAEQRGRACICRQCATGHSSLVTSDE